MTHLSHGSRLVLCMLLKFDRKPTVLTAMVFVYDFHPAAETMMSRHFGSSPRNGDAAFPSHQTSSVASTYRNAGLFPVLC